MDESKTVDILLSTFNGARYLGQLLDSIMEQSYQRFKIIVRDDGSSDGTVGILTEYAKRYPLHFKVDIGESNLGVVGSFEQLCIQSTAEYIMFCDQDDIWFKGKIQQLLHEITHTERQHDRATPVLVCSDLVLIDRSGSEIGRSFWAYAGISWNKKQPETILLSNCVTGCASIFNRRLLLDAIPFPREVQMHDWWLGAIAALSGELVLVPYPTVAYRQHATNVLGSGISKSPLEWPKKLFRVLTGQHRRRYFLECIQQASALCNKLNLKDVARTCYISQLTAATRVTRVLYLLRNPMLKHKTILLNPKVLFFK